MGNCGSAPAVKDDPPAPRPSAQPVAPSTAPKPAPVANKEDRSQAKKSASMDVSESSRDAVSGQASAIPGSGEGDDRDDDDAPVWKAKRRVSRRLSLEVKKKPGSATGSPAPAYLGAVPTEAEKAAWDAAADLDIAEPQPKSNDDFSRKVGSSDSLAGFLKSGSASKKPAVLPPKPVPKEEEEDDNPRTFKVKRGARRLSLEMKKDADLSLLAAVRRTSSTPLTGQYSRTLPVKSLDILPPEVAASLEPKVIDFAQNAKTVPEEAAERGEDEDDRSVSSMSEQAAMAILRASKEGSPDPFRARRRRSRRLSLEIEKRPDDAVLAAVRRTHSAPITAAAARAAMGEEAWAEVAAGGGADQGKSPVYEPPPPAYGAEKAKVVTAPVIEMKLESESKPQVIDFASHLKSISDVKKNVSEAVEIGSQYTRTTRKKGSRRRSMDIFKKALAAGATEASAVQLARDEDPDFNAKEYAASLESEEDDQMMDFSDVGGFGRAAWANPSKKEEEDDSKATPPGLAGISI